ncbi:MAG TPA: hypothetical protein VL200_15375 [Lacunisphaera sp.]|nr:hypothetical protein [Lacunisphaera sp.]
MLPFLLVLALFVFFTAVGLAVISLLRPRLGVLWSWFLAPTTGMALTLVIMTRLNVWGIPVKAFGPWLAVALGVLAAAVLAWRRPVCPWRQLRPFALLTLLFVVYAGWPMFRFGFNWISYANDDMANYCLAADRFLDHGYYDLPEQTELEGRDYTQHYWFMHGLQQIRPGSEMILAFTSSVTGLNPHEVFMPVIFVFSMLQICAMGAVAMFRGRYRKIALLAFFLFATSPLFALGTLYQLIAQVGGIAILLSACAVLLNTRENTWRRVLLAGLLTTGLGIFYPEVAPFVALSIILFGLHLRYTNPEALKPFALVVVCAAVLTFVCLGTNIYQFINTLVMQSVGSAGLGAMAEINDQSGGLVLFPWTLVPSFIPMLFGLHAFGVVGFDPLISIQIAVGMCFLAFFVWMAFGQLFRREPAGYIAVIMIALGFFLFFKGQDFGLFKLAMFAQPVITLLLAHEFYKLLSSPRWRRTGRWAVAVFFVCTFPSQFYYSFASLGTYGGGLSEIVGGSEYGVRFTPPKNLKFDAIESDMSNVVSAKLLSQYTKGIDTRFLSRSYMDNIANIAVLTFLRNPDPDLGPQARLIEKLSLLRGLLPPEILKGDVADYRVMTINKLDNNWTETSSRHLDYDNRLFVSIRSQFDHFNKANPGTGWSYQNIYQYKLEKDVHDRLVFIHSELGPHYYSSARFKAAFFQREPEPVTKGNVYFHGTGRYNMFEIINPSPKIRVVVDFTRTSLGGDRYHLPTHAVVIGEEDYPLGFVGSGSARVFSPIIRPERFEQQDYITIDFADKATPIGKAKTGLMKLWGSRYNLDDRRLVGFTRDISVITEDQYEKLERPTKISRFPQDLSRYPGLEYSGIFEDGWVGPESFFKLAASHPGQVLYFKGYVPDTPLYRTKGLDLTISINDRPTEVVNLRAGEFTLTRLIREPAAVTTVRLNFSGSMPYGETDTRYLSAFVHEISLGDLPDLAAFKAIKNRQGEGFALEGVDEDGWINHQAKFNPPPFDEVKVLKIDLEMPGWSPLASNELKVALNGRPFSTQVVPRGSYYSVFVPVRPEPNNSVTLESASVFPIPNSTRERSFVIKNITFENLSRTDLFTHGWHKSGYFFTPGQIDQDGWIGEKSQLVFPATPKLHHAIIEVVRYPSRADYALDIAVNGGAAEAHPLKLDQTERITIPLSADRDTTVTLSSPRVFELSAADPRQRSARIVNIDFD